MPNDPEPATEEQPSNEGKRVPFWTDEFIPTEQLMEEQGITGPPDFDSWPALLPPITEVDGY